MPSLETILGFIEQHHVWGAVLFGLLAFGESLVFIGVLVPGTMVLMAMGPLVGNGTLPFFELFVLGALGALIGDLVSYAVGRKLGPTARESRWMAPHRPLIERGVELFQRWGWIAVFAGRFIGPMRASVPFVAGLMGMREGVFLSVSAASAVAWVPVLLLPGAAIGAALDLYHAGDWRMAALVLTGAALVVGLSAFGFRHLLRRLR